MNYRILSAAFLILPCILPLTAVAQQDASAVDGYETIADIPYREPQGLDEYAVERCRLDVYRPQQANNAATVVWFHGGGLTGGNKSIPQALRERGVIVVAVNYRLSPKVKVEVCLEDAAAAVAWTFHNIDQHGGSAERVFVSGHSAGGYLTSMIGLDKRWLAAFDIDADQIAGLIPFSGHTITHFTARKEKGVGAKQPVVDQLAPLFHVRADAPPLLLITGDRQLEMLGRYEENAYMWRMMLVAGHPASMLYELDGFNHGQMAEPAFPLLLRFMQQHSK
ncbi:alpha/beta hydrolase [Roseimaritima ulvae]|uniref:Carboxylesterase NlhH n=1 Tax=Roseimaritima ulvae TaxID=980254 RepID=A0A5B9QW62_9BACT|nr:alpha/beta hydrolase [Roseimaritima ulvae]QEG38183.1 Carboxylesterase NlhH [Roseimaritima ulvae]